MLLIDKQFLERPTYGVGMMTDHLRLAHYDVGPKRIRRLMRLMNLKSVAPGPNISKPNKAHKVYPYLLKNLEIQGPNHVWATDITYIRMARGWVYLVAIMDWFSRSVLSWQVSTTMDASFCVWALEDALSRYPHPKIFNSDQGSQFTSGGFTDMLTDHKIKISMDGVGRCFDNIFIERLWRSLKYEEVYLNEYTTVPEAVERIGDYFDFYNHKRPHSTFKGQPPWTVYKKVG